MIHYLHTYVLVSTLASVAHPFGLRPTPPPSSFYSFNLAQGGLLKYSPTRYHSIPCLSCRYTESDASEEVSVRGRWSAQAPNFVHPGRLNSPNLRWIRNHSNKRAAPSSTVSQSSRSHRIPESNRSSPHYDFVRFGRSIPVTHAGMRTSKKAAQSYDYIRFGRK